MSYKENTMIANYHAHTPLCRHATGALTDYVENAISRGLEVFGFSDHAPQWFPGKYYSHMRMYPHQLQEYCQQVRQLAHTYKEKIQIPLGLEAEYYPQIFPRLLQEARDAGIEYFLLGQHWVGNEENEPYAGDANNSESLLQRYCTQVADALQTGVFSYIAHPDLIHFRGDPKIYDRHMRWLCREAKAADTPLELNFLGMVNNRHYPTDAFWRIAGEEGCSVVFGIDAHHPDHMLDLQVERAAMRMAESFGLKVVPTVNLRKIG